MAKAEVLCSESDDCGLLVILEQGTCQDWWRLVYREAESMNDWFKGTYCATELIEWSVGDIVIDSRQAFVRW